jgi:hypothetical protein
VEITPAPTEDEAAAIAAALEVAWPKGVVEEPPAPDARWRFSGRWWTKPVPAGRARP